MVDEILDDNTQQPQDNTLQQPSYTKSVYDGLADKFGAKNMLPFDEFSKKIATDKNFAKNTHDALIENYGEKNVEDFNSFYDKVKKNTSSTIPASSTSLVSKSISQSDGSQQPSNEQPIDVLGLSKQADELSKATKTINSNVPSSAGYISQIQQVPDDEKVAQSQQIKQQLKDSGYDDDFVNAVSDLPKISKETKGVSEDDLANLYKTNKVKFNQTVASIKWQTDLHSAIDNSIKEVQSDNTLSDQAKQDKIAAINSDKQSLYAGQLGGNKKGYKDKLADSDNAIALVRKYLNTTEEQNKAIKNIMSDHAISYGTDEAINERTQNPISGLTPIQSIGFDIYSRQHPEQADALKKYISVSDKDVATDYYSNVARQSKLKQLEEIGLNTIYANNKSHYDDLVQKSQAQNGLNPNDLQAGNNYKSKIDAATNELGTLSTKYPDVSYLDADKLAQEELGQKKTGLDYLTNLAAYSTYKAGKGVFNLLAQPFRDDKGQTMAELNALGEEKVNEPNTYVTQANTTSPDFKILKKKELQDKIDEVKNDKTLNNTEKQTKVASLFRDNQDEYSFEKSDEGLNVGANTLIYGVGKMAAELFPYMAMEALTGGGASAGIGRKLLSTFGSVLTTSYQDELAKETANNEANPRLKAFTNTGINALAFTVGDIPAKIKAAAGTTSAMGIAINKLTDDEVLAALRNKPNALKTFFSSLPSAAKEGVLGAAKMQPILGAAQLAQQKIDGNEIDYHQFAKEQMLQGLNFAIFSTGLGIMGKAINSTKVPDAQKEQLYLAGKNSDEALSILKQSEEKGTVTPTDALQIRNNIEKAKAVYAKTPMVDAKGNPLDDKSRNELMFLKMQENDLLDHASKDLPQSLKDAMAKRVIDIQDKIDKVYKGTFIEEQQQKVNNTKLTKEADYLLQSLDKGTYPKFIDNHLKSIAEENGITGIKVGETTVGQVIKALKQKKENGETEIQQPPKTTKPIEEEINKPIGETKETKPKGKESIVPEHDNIETTPNYRTAYAGNHEGEQEFTHFILDGKKYPIEGNEELLKNNPDAKLDKSVESQTDTKKQQTENIKKFNVPLDEGTENPKGETMQDFVGRVVGQYEKDKANNPDNSVIMAHSSVLKALKSYEALKDKPEFKDADWNNLTPEQAKLFTDHYTKESTNNGDIETYDNGKGGKIKIARHGQTEDNLTGKFRNDETNLTPKGIQQAKEVGTKLGEEPPKIISSDLPRAIHTANLAMDEIGKGKETKPIEQPTFSDAEYNEFIDKGKVSEERLNDIANKVKKQEPLSDREKAIFTDKTSEINKIIATQPKEEQPTELSKQQKVNDLIDKVNNKKLSPAQENEARIAAKELGLEYDKTKQKIVNSDGRVIKKREEIQNKTVVEDFDKNTYGKQVNDHINTVVENPLAFKGLEILGTDGKRLSEAQQKNAIESIKNGKVNYAGKALFDFIDNAIKKGGVEIEDVTTGKRKLVNANDYFNAFKEPIKPLSDAEIEMLNTQLGEDVFDKLINNEINEIYEQENAEQNQPINGRTETEVKPKVSGSEETTGTTEKQKTITPNTEQDGSGTGVPPEPPSPEHKFLYEGSKEKRLSGLAEHMVDAENVPKDVKDYFKDKDYAKADYVDAANIAQSVVKELGIDDALVLARGNDLHPSVRSAIYGESLMELENEANKNGGINGESEAAKKWEEVADEYASELTGKGQFSSQAAHYYSESSLGFVTKRLEKMQGHALTKEQSAEVQRLTDKVKELETKVADAESNKKLVDAIDDRFNKDEAKDKQLKAEQRNKKRKEISDFFDSAKFKKDALYAVPIPPKLINGAIEVMKQTYLAGESAVNAVEKAIEHISKEIKEWDSDKFKKEWLDKLKTVELNLSKETPEAKNIRRLEKELENLQKGIAKQISPKRELTKREKDLQEQIFEEKKKLGLVKSKEIKEKEINIEEKLTDEEKQRRAKEESLKDLQKQFEDKKRTDLKFSTDEAKDLWDYTKENYLNKGIGYVDAVKQVAKDTGLTNEQVNSAFNSSKTKPITDAKWKEQYDLRVAKRSVNDYIDAQNKSDLYKAWKAVSNVPRQITTAIHSHVFMGTHYPMGIMTPHDWEYYFKAIAKSAKAGYGGDAMYERLASNMESDPNYGFWIRHNLRSDLSDTRTDNFEEPNNLFGKKLKALGELGTRGMLGLKDLRMKMANKYWNALPESDRTPEVADTISYLVNVATGATSQKLPTALQEGLFSAPMESARWGKMFKSPAMAADAGIRITKALVKGEDIRPQDKVFLKIWGSRVGQQLGMYAGALALAGALQNKLFPTNKINITDPSKKDYMKFKVGNTEIDVSGGMLDLFNLVYSIAHYIAVDKSRKTMMADVGGKGFGYLLNKAQPAIGDAAEIAIGRDYMGNPLPFRDKEVGAGQHKLSGWEYAASKSPIFISGTLENIFKGAEEQGLDRSKTDKILNGVLQFGITAGWGAHSRQSYPSIFTEKELDEPAVKYLISKDETIMPHAKSSLHPVNSYGKEVTVTDSKYKEFLEERKNIIKKDVEILISGQGKKVGKNGVFMNLSKEEADKLTSDQLKPYLMRITKEADKQAMEKVFSGQEKPKSTKEGEIYTH